MKRKEKNGSGCLAVMLMLLIISLAGMVGYKIYLNVFSNEQKSSNIALKKSKSNIPFQKVEKENQELSMKYYYQQLNKEEQLIYREMVQGIKEEQSNIYLHSDVAETVLHIFKLMLNDYPEFFWCSGDAAVTVYPKTDQENSYAVLRATYLYELEERSKRQTEIDQAVSACLAGIDKNAAEYDKIEYIYNYIIQTTDYNLESPDNQNIYSVLVNRQSVCAGYAKANQYLLEKLGVFCIYLTGTATSPESGIQPHGWNIVQCNGEFYQEDVTWGDPVFSQDDTAMNGIVNYDYLLCTDSEILKTHIIDTELSVPLCTAITSNYFIVHGMNYDYFDADATLRTMKQAIDAGLPFITFKYANEALYQTAYDTIVNNLAGQSSEYLANIYGLPEVQYFYQVNEQINRITVIWQYG